VRVAAVVEEATESMIGSLLRFASASCAALVAVVLAIWMFPFESQAQALPDDAGITCDAGAALQHRPPLRYPAGTTAGGLVILDATVNSKGEVTDARVLSGPEELRRIALESVLQWHYSSDSAPKSARITIQFRPNGFAPAPPLPTKTQPPAASPETKRVASAPPPPPPPPPAPTAPAPFVQPAPPPTETNAQRLQIGGNVQSANLVTKIVPAYPPLAKQARVQGTVSLAVVIGKDGVVLNVEVISGDPLLTEAAVDAVRQWVYRPTLLNGEPVEVATHVDVNFTLSQ